MQDVSHVLSHPQSWPSIAEAAVDARSFELVPQAVIRGDHRQGKRGLSMIEDGVDRPSGPDQAGAAARQRAHRRDDGHALHPGRGA